MQLLRHSIEVSTTIDAAFQMCVDVEKWPDYFPPCKKAKILKKENNKQFIEIQAEANGSELTWQSERDIDFTTHTIQFRQSKPSPLLKKMEGAWRFDRLKEGILISLEHAFEINDVIDGIIDTVNTKEDAIAYMEKCIHQNSQRELEAIKILLEKKKLPQSDTSHEFEESILISLPANKVYEHLQNITRWPERLPHCNKVDVIYDDGIDQEFYMEVDVNGKNEKIRSIRHCEVPYLITYFQPNPPPILKKHRGSWRIQSIEPDKTLLTSYHFIEIHSDNIKKRWSQVTTDEAKKLIETAISNNSRITMESIAQTMNQIEEK